jgi:hypothetical protein
MLVDIGIDTRHLDDDRRFPSAPTIERCAAGSRGARPCDGERGRGLGWRMIQVATGPATIQPKRSARKRP